MNKLRNITIGRTLFGIALALAAGTTIATTGPDGSGPGASAAGQGFAEFQPARLIETTRPNVPRTGNRPQLVSYPGMPASERPGKDWTPKYGLWTLKVAVQLDERGQPVDARIAENPLSRQGMVRRYERLVLRSVENWRYAPAEVDGQTVASEVIMAFHFDTSLGRSLAPSVVGAMGQATPFPMTDWRSRWRSTIR
jgi:hypothetical protein